MVMYESYLIPSWFFGFDIAMELLFAFVTFFVAIFAFKISSVTKERKIRLFGIGFLLISLSYFVWAGLNYWFVGLAQNGFREISLNQVAFIGIVSLYVYIGLFTMGAITLAYINCDNSRGRAYYLMIGLSLLVIASSLYKLISFRILCIFIISFILYRYFEEYLKNKNKKTFLVAVAFAFLLLSNIDFLFLSVYYEAYVLGHILELAAYLLILVNLIKSVKRWVKKETNLK